MCVCVLVAQLCPILCKSARLPWTWTSQGKNTGMGSHSLSKGSSQPRDQTQVSYIAGLVFTIWATRKFMHVCAKSLQSCLTLLDAMSVACQAPLSKGFFRQEYWSGLPSPFPGDLPNPGMEPVSLALQLNSLPSEPPGKPKSIYI